LHFAASLESVLRRLVIISNRVCDLNNPSQSGGLVVAVGEALGRHGGIWFGWNGDIVEDGEPLHSHGVTQGNVTTITVPLSRSEFDNYYHGLANSTLWPVFHYRLDLAEFSNEFLDAYRQVNARFADEVIILLEHDDVIWVHDFHLIPLGSKLRSRGCTQKIGFFLHIPFPPPEVLTAIPEHEWLIDSLFAYDLVGFQSQTDLNNFRRYLIETNDTLFLPHDRVARGGREITARVFPIGIDADHFAQVAHSEQADAIVASMNMRDPGLTLIIGVDRLDYTKGLPERFRAFERLLELHPELRTAVSLMQIAQPTREDVDAYVDIREELERLTGAINGRYGSFDWTPVRYINRSVPRDHLAALFRASKVGLVTPVRDGMNLVAKEYVVAQDADDPGVLVLSKFAGAAEALTEALIVNPFDPDEVADALRQAISMDKLERQQRHRALRDKVFESDVFEWQRQFLTDLEQGRAPHLIA